MDLDTARLWAPIDLGADSQLSSTPGLIMFRGIGLMGISS